LRKNDWGGRMFVFENLIVYQKSLKLSIELTKNAETFPYKYSRIRDQLIGAVISIPLNIAEGHGRYSNKERLQFLKIARGSAFEMVPILAICSELSLLDKNTWIDRVEEICKILNALINKKQIA